MYTLHGILMNIQNRYLCNHIWYYAAHTSSSNRRGLIGSARSVIEAYKAAFFVHATRVVAERSLSVDVDAVFADMLVDAVGFMGFFSLYLSTAPQDADMLPTDSFPEMKWGDHKGWRAAICKRQVRMSVRALGLFWEIRSLSPSDTASPASRLSVQDIIKILQEDDKYLATEHLTEFWTP